MLPLSQRIAFALFALLMLTLGARGFYRLYLRIARGREDADRRADHPARRVWYALATTLTQARVFRKRLVLSVFHSFIFYAFVLYLVVNLIDAVDGYVTLRSLGSAPLLALYGFVTDLFSLLAIVGVIAFVLRRFALKSRRDFSFNAKTLLHPQVRNGYLQRDSVIVSAFILVHVSSRVLGNAARLAMEGATSGQPLSNLLAHLFTPHDALAWRIVGYWGALGSVLLFLLYFPYSKHLHLFMAPLKYGLRRDAGSGELPPVQIDLEAAEPQIGAAHLADLSWPRLLDAYACIQCNRCQDVCPASQTGKALSPAALEINKRMALNAVAGEVGALSLTGKSAFERGADRGPALLKAIISPEAVWACTTCGACMEVCPTQDEQMLDIIDIRRNMVLLQGEFPSQLQGAFRGMERSRNPWALARDKRMAWAESLTVPTIEEVPDPDVLYWVGCAASYDSSAQKTARAVVQLLTEARVNFAVLGKQECCTGDTARRAGNELLYQELATEAIGTLQRAHPKLVLASCPHCVNIIGKEYPQLGGHFTVMHHTEYLASMLEEGKLTASAADTAITFHDPCYLGRHRGTYEDPRAVLKVLTNDYVELGRTKSNAFCCGAGGAQFWKEEEPGTERVSENRFREVQRTLSAHRQDKVLAVGCPFCKSMLQSTPSASTGDSIAIKDIAELLWEGVQRAKGIDPAATLTPIPLPSAPLASEEKAISKQPQTAVISAAMAPASNPVFVEAISEPLVAAPQEQIVAKPERKKWTPKQPSTTPAEAAPAAVSSTEDTPQSPPAEAEPVAPIAPPARKKWQPGGPR